MILSLPELNNKLTLPMSHTFISRDGECRQVTESVLAEHSLQLCVNGEITADFVCLPQYLPQLILGHLATEGMICSIGDVDSLEISDDWSTAHVKLRSSPDTRDMAKLHAVQWQAEWVFSLADRFARGMPIHEETFATHSCFLAKGDECLFQCEDIGRHNALDKAVGHAVMQGLDPKECILYSSGRMPVDMVSKAIRAGIPLLAAKGAPTAKAAELARKYSLTLVCAARRDRMKLFSGSAPAEY